MRLDAYLAKQHPEYSRATWQKFIKAGRVKVAGKVILEPKHPATKPIVFDLDSRLKTLDSNTDMSVLYEDKNVLIIDKPAGVLTHSKGTLNDEFTVSDFVRLRATSDKSTVLAKSVDPDRAVWVTSGRGTPKQVFAKQKLLGEEPKAGPKHPEDETDFASNRFGIVHRLDRGTSGVIICAKNEETLRFLQKQFSNRKVKKTYLAVVENVPNVISSRAGGLGSNDQRLESINHFVIDLPISRNPKKPSTFRVDPKGKPAITHVKLLKTFKDGTALLELKPITGRTHQLRVHLAHIGSPIVGDPIYGAKKAGGLASNVYRQTSNRMLLHAAELEITLPGGERKVFKSKPPKGFLLRTGN